MYPLVDHLADKISATVDRYGRRRLPSTRVRDLVDLVAIIDGASVRADAQRRALVSEAERRGLELPMSFDVPDRVFWERRYRTEAASSLLASALTLDEALDVVRPFIDPLFDGTARGVWDFERRAWVSERRVSKPTKETDSKR
ncbi:MAG TPA: nucleotidyl transferase AbiEii/AbiGii toxin family protein [Verrucomicrobiae bacterium]|nr:nucleotidyl transferase AbiEii/AbiGii toxin family protein [Verrucomicrobiae bacterium]